MKTLHILTTRFNIFVDEGRNDNEDWLGRRIELFRRSTLQSITNQTNKEFTWFLYFNSNTRKKYLDKVKEMVKGNVNNFSIVLLDETKRIFHHLRTIDFGKYDYLITSRLDNDDMVRYDFIDYINSKSKNVQTKLILDFTDGMIYNLKDRKVYTSHRNKGSNILSLIEKIDNSKPLTIWFRNHFQAVESRIKRKAVRSPFFILCIGDHNLNNTIKLAKKEIAWKQNDLFPNLNYIKPPETI